MKIYYSFAIIVLLCISSLPVYSIVKYEVINENKGNNNSQIVISPQDKTEKNLIELGEYFRELNKNNDLAFVYIYDNKKAALMYNRINTLTNDEGNFYDKHFVAIFWKAKNGRYDFTITLDGINGPKKVIKFNRNEDKKTTQSTTPKSSSDESSDVVLASFAGILLFFIFILPFIWLIIICNWKKHRFHVWFEFWVAFFIGFIGIQKFREKKYITGLIYFSTFGFFGIGWFIDCFRYLNAAITNKPILPIQKKKTEQQIIKETVEEQKKNEVLEKLAIIEDENSDLPIVNPMGLILQKNEICHFAEEANSIELKNYVVGRHSNSWGHMHWSESTRDNVAIKTPGVFTITNQRIVFSGLKGSFNRNISDLTQITPYDDAIGFQFGDKHYVLQMENEYLAQAIIQRLLSKK